MEAYTGFAQVYDTFMDNVPYEEYFWDFAWQTEFYDEIRKIKDNFTEEQRKEDIETGIRLISLAAKEADCVGDDRIK